jgi:hypothetical protein
MSGITGVSNFPEPATTQCGPLDGSTLPIYGLRSAWGILALPGAVDDNGEVPPGTLRLRLGEQLLQDCQSEFIDASCTVETSADSSAFIDGSGGDGCGWAFSFTLRPHQVREGQHKLETLTDPNFELAIENTVTGDLELTFITDECIAGELSGVETDELAQPILAGGFVAQVCERSCLPGPGKCGA